jgi:LETM1-like protein
VRAGVGLSVLSNIVRDKKIFPFSDKPDDKPDNRLNALVKVEPQSLQQKYSRENVQKYFFTRFFNYISNYDKVLEKKFPSAMHVYRIFMVGVKDFYGDMKKYIQINIIMNSSEKGIQALTRKEMEMLKKMPSDMMKVAPVLISAALPLANYVVFPLA